MFAPYKVANFETKVSSLYLSAIPLIRGTVVDIDTTDTIAIVDVVGFSTNRLGSLKAATIAASATGYNKPLGVLIQDVKVTGASFQERVLGSAANLYTVPVGSSPAVFCPATHDKVSSDQYVGALPGDTGAVGIIDTTNVANLGIGVGVFQGRFRIAQAGDAVIARYVGNSSVNGNATAIFEFA